MNSRRGVIGCWVVAMVVLLLTVSCSAKKKLVSNPAQYQNYEWVSSKMTMDLNVQGIEYNNVNGQLRMRRDSTIWVSASVLGVEMVRTLITADSVVVINRMDKTYLAEPLSQVAETLHLPATLQENQRLLLGNGGDDPVEFQFGSYHAKIRHSDVIWNVPTTFPIKINPNYERMKL